MNYDKDSWQKLINLLTNRTFNLRQIHVINRATIIDDVMNLARANYIDYEIAISATMYLRREIDYLPWRAFYNNLPYLNNRFRGRDIESLYKVCVIITIIQISGYTMKSNYYFSLKLNFSFFLLLK